MDQAQLTAVSVARRFKKTLHFPDDQYCRVRYWSLS